MKTNIAKLYNKHIIILKPLLSEIKRHVKKGNTVIDLGCGTGLHIKTIEKQIGSDGILICVDKNKQMVSYCKKRFSNKNAIFKRLSAEDISELKIKADVVFASLVLQFTDMEKSISKIRKVLKPKGKLIFAVPLYRTGITTGIDSKSKKFKAELEKNLKESLEKFGTGKTFSVCYPNSRADTINKQLLKNNFKILRWSKLPLEKNGLKELLEYYKVPWRSKSILKLPFKSRYKILKTALQKTFSKYPNFLVKRFYLIGTSQNAK